MATLLIESDSLQGDVYPHFTVIRLGKYKVLVLLKQGVCHDQNCRQSVKPSGSNGSCCEYLVYQSEKNKASIDTCQKYCYMRERTFWIEGDRNVHNKIYIKNVWFYANNFKMQIINSMFKSTA